MNRFVRNLLAGKFVELIHTGKFRASTGPVNLTDEHLQQIAEDYNKDFRVGTLTIGHPPMLMFGEINTAERPAHGVLAEVKKLGDVLYGRFENLTEEIKADLRAGKWVNRSAELSRKLPETGRAYITGLALLGASQPAIPEMFSADDESISILCGDCEDESKSPEIEKHESTPTNKGSKMNPDELARLKAVEDKLAAQAAESATILAAVNKQTDALTALSTKVGELTALKTDYDALSASTTALVDAQAQLAVNEATKGIPKALCPDEKKASLLSLYKTDRKAFDVEKAIFASMRDKFGYLTKEVVTDDAGEPVAVNAKTDPKADPNSAGIAVKARELRAKDPKLSVEQSIKLAKEQVA